MFLSVIALAAGVAPVTLADLKGLPPEGVGNYVLAGRVHGPVAAVERLSEGGPSGETRLILIERVATVAGGCARRRWVATFAAADGIAAEQASLRTVAQVSEVSARPESGCGAVTGFAQLNGGLDVRGGLAALARLQAIRQGSGRIAACEDTTTSDICSSGDAARGALRMLNPWAVMRRGEEVLLWLGTPGQVVTEVRFMTADPDVIRIDRRNPAPF